MAKSIQYHLKGPGFSGRGVRLLVLAPSETMDVSRTAAKLVGKDANGVEFRAATVEESVKATLVSFTADPQKSLEKLAESAWTKCSLSAIESGDVKLDKVFTPKDFAAIISIYSRNHEVSKEEIDDIVGKAVEVSAG